MSRKPAIMATGGILALVAVVGLWPGDHTERPETPIVPIGSASPAPVGVEPVEKSEGTTDNAPETVAGSSVGFEPGEFSVFGDAVQFIPGERCDEAGECTRQPVALHEYAEYTDEQLRALSAFDGAAAIVLANRLGETDWSEARRYAARGFVLTGDPYAFHMARQFSGVSRGASFDRDGKLDLASARRAYLWARLGYELGVNDAASLDYQASILHQHGVDDLSQLDAAAAAERRRVENVRLQLVGEGFK